MARRKTAADQLADLFVNLWNRKSVGSEVNAEKIIAPWRWYIMTGRCPTDIENKFRDLSDDKLSAMGNILVYYGGTAEYDRVINRLKKFLNEV